MNSPTSSQPAPSTLDIRTFASPISEANTQPLASSSTRPTVLELRAVTCAYEPQRPAIEAMSLTAAQGDILCLLGPSGCGKTTTLRAIAGFERVTYGEIRLNGRLVSSPQHHVPSEERRVGMVFQDYALFPHLCVADNITFGLHRWPAAARRERLRIMLDLIGLKGLEHRYPHELSGGQRQRVALARALAPNPVLLLLDEPFSNLDPDMTVKMREELLQLLRGTRTTTVLVTHDHDEAFAMADQVAVLHGGRLVQCDAPETLYHLPNCPFVAEFVGQADFIPGVIENGKVMTEIGEFPRQGTYQGGNHVLVMIRPDDIRIVRVGHGTARIEYRQFRGSENLYRIRLPSGRHIHCAQPSTHVYAIGTAVELEIIATHTVLFEQSSTR
ncbi:MAG: ABC transporter ATP-binding protein [Nitrospirae bacterium]|nr:MAG: ABC transporter ATP-binding protein [Nitrospirota bacterium]